MTHTIIQGTPVHKWSVNVYQVDPNTKYHTLANEFLYYTKGEADWKKAKLDKMHDNIHVIINEVVVYE